MNTCFESGKVDGTRIGVNGTWCGGSWGHDKASGGVGARRSEINIPVVTRQSNSRPFEMGALGNVGQLDAGDTHNSDPELFAVTAGCSWRLERGRPGIFPKGDND